ncbi:MAG: BlaI/MecI/CopY family transcriptional regulator [Phycisphaerae bacterium]|jgi:predicted transcriptional regulator
MNEHVGLSRRERQIMDIIYARGEASASDVLAGIADPPSRAGIRTLLRILESKGHLRHYKRGKEFVFQPTQPVHQAAESALDRVLDTFFGGSLEKAVALRLAGRKVKVSDSELKRLAGLIRHAREKGK